jgi:hypothetical protein
MIKLLIFTFTYFLISSQNSVLNSRIISTDNHSLFEQELLSEIIKIYNIKNNTNLKIYNSKIIKIDKLFQPRNDSIIQLSLFGWSITEERKRKFLITKPYLFSKTVILKRKNISPETKQFRHY